MPELDMQQSLGRAKNAIQDYLVRKLLYPKVYLDADWNGNHVDVLAIDRTGVGDVHLVEIPQARPHFVPPVGEHELTMISGEREFDACIERLHTIAAQYRYLAILVPGSRKKEYYAASRLVTASLASDGIGRIGLLVVDLETEEPLVKAVMKPERFRSAPEIVKLADEYVAGHVPNWEIRE